jgi:hypothetical protein
MDELGITAGLDCFTKGDLGACAETAVNVLMSSIGGLAAKAMAKYAFRLGKAKAVGKLLWKLGKEIYSGVKGFFKTQEDLRLSVAARERLEAAAPSCVKRNSFTAGTKVLMADGRARPIKDIKLGDKVRATDPRTGRSAAKTVTALLRHTGPREMVDVTVMGGGTIHSTDKHPFYNVTTGTYTEAEDLRVTDRLRTADGHTAHIFSVRTYPLRLTSYNLTIADLHTYYVMAGTTPVLVHNCGEGVPSGVGNLKDGAHMATSDAMETAAEFVGPGYRDMGGGRFLSEDGLRQIRLTDADLAHPRQNPHINFETYDSPIGPGVRSRGPVSNIHIYLPEEPGWHLP